MSSKESLLPISEHRERLAATLGDLARYCRTPNLLPDTVVTRNTLVVLHSLISLAVKSRHPTAEQQAEAEEHAAVGFDEILLDEDAFAKKLAKLWELVKDDDHNGFMDLYRGAPGPSEGGTWLLPSNRKLRQLLGVSLRNILFEKSEANTLEAIDDEALPSSYNTPAKLLALRSSLEHSKSAEDIKLDASRDATIRLLSSTDFEQEQFSATVDPKRPPYSQMRRRSTNNWGNITPDDRQKKLEDVAANKLAETFFSLHGVEIEQPIYVSETIAKTMNPSFQYFSMADQSSNIKRLPEVIVNVWSKTDSMSEYTHLLQVQVHLAAIRWLGKHLEDLLIQPLPVNSILLHMTDGIYLCSGNYRSVKSWPEKPVLPSPARPYIQPKTLERSETFNDLMKLKNVSTCVDDALNTRIGIMSSINQLLDDHKADRQVVDAAGLAKESLLSTHEAVTATDVSVSIVKKRKAKAKSSNKQRNLLMIEGRRTQEREADLHKTRSTNIDIGLENISALKSQIRGQIRRVAKELHDIYPIEPFENGKTLAFTIASQYLPNADDLYKYAQGSASEESTAAALGFVATTMQHLSKALSFVFPYPITAFCSFSSIEDPIAKDPPNKKRVFPLYQSGMAQPDFEYGVFLLNTNLVSLMTHENLRVVNPKTTLANLKYLLEVLMSGKGEVPARKVGDIKALAGPVQKVNINGEIAKPKSFEEWMKMLSMHVQAKINQALTSGELNAEELGQMTMEQAFKFGLFPTEMIGKSSNLLLPNIDELVNIGYLDEEELRAANLWRDEKSPKPTKPVRADYNQLTIHVAMKIGAAIEQGALVPGKIPKREDFIAKGLMKAQTPPGKDNVPS